MPTKRGLRQQCPQKRLTCHELAIRTLVFSDVRICRNGFARAVDTFLNKLGVDEDDRPIIDFRLDAYMIDEEAGEIIMFEVEDTHFIDPDKLRGLTYFWFDADGMSEEVFARLVTVDRYGRREGDIDLCALFYAFVPEQPEKAAA